MIYILGIVGALAVVGFFFWLGRDIDEVVGYKPSWLEEQEKQRKP